MTANLNLKSTCVWLEDNHHPLTRRERQRICVFLPPARPARQEIELKRRMFQDVYLELPPNMSVHSSSPSLAQGCALGKQ